MANQVTDSHLDELLKQGDWKGKTETAEVEMKGTEVEKR